MNKWSKQSGISLGYILLILLVAVGTAAVIGRPSRRRVASSPAARRGETGAKSGTWGVTSSNSQPKLRSRVSRFPVGRQQKL